MKKTKQQILLLLFLHQNFASNGKERGLRYSQISSLLKLAPTTLRGGLSAFLIDGWIERNDSEIKLSVSLTIEGTAVVREVFPILSQLESSAGPYWMAIVTTNPSGDRKRGLERLGAFQYRAGIWILPESSKQAMTKSQKLLLDPLMIRLSTQDEKEVMRHLRLQPLYSKANRERVFLRNAVMSKKSSSAVMEKLRKTLSSQLLIPEYNYKQELRLLPIIAKISSAVFG